jgi:hypothetical protein
MVIAANRPGFYEAQEAALTGLIQTAGDRLIDLPSAFSLICRLPRRQHVQCFPRLPGMTHTVTVSI